jgi:diadenosine tetraphosphate (Ap4A) HIT family hydrolase
VDEAACPICSRPDRRPLGIVAELIASWVTAEPDAALPGYACVVAKKHVVEPYDLSPGEGQAFWQDCMLAARVLAGLFGPTKMNYEVHGNTVPHLHMHLYPRFENDPYEGGPISGSARFTRTPDEIARIGQAITLARSEVAQ